MKLPVSAFNTGRRKVKIPYWFDVTIMGVTIGKTTGADFQDEEGYIWYGRFIPSDEFENFLQDNVKTTLAEANESPSFNWDLKVDIQSGEMEIIKHISHSDDPNTLIKIEPRPHWGAVGVVCLTETYGEVPFKAEN
jgi:hypothetical protein